MQIGRTSPLSEDKSRSHFPIIREKTGIAYNRMLFFDDCLWSDHCATVSRNCAGVVSKRTPSGLQTTDWVAGLKAFHQQRIKEENLSSPNEL
jgi:magnesium-dependent phosphatase 1